jgi:hypothetical protein
MVRKTLTALVLAAFVGSTGSEFASVASAAAMPIGNAPVVISSDSNIQPVAWVYVEKKHGKRYRAKRKGYGYYYNGWYYPRPWWTVAGPGPSFVYVEKKHGKRYRAKRKGYYYYNGWWYPRPYWRPGIDICIGC